MEAIITNNRPGQYSLITKKGREILVMPLKCDGLIVVSLVNPSRLLNARTHTWEGAIAHYKSADIREAIEALRDYLAA